MIKPTILSADLLNQWQQEMLDALNAAASPEALVKKTASNRRGKSLTRFFLSLFNRGVA